MDTQTGSWAGNARRLADQLREPVPAPQPRTIVIVGAGFSGTAVALNLLRLPQARPLRIVLVERTESRMMRGTAYASERNPHLLNVPAGRMSASSANPLEFLAFAQRVRPATTAADFLPRKLYGDYLEWTLRTAALAAPPRVHLERRQGEVTGVERLRRTRSLRVHLADSAAIEADTVVLALGNPPPANLPGAASLHGTGRYIADPWQMAPARRSGETVLIVGTGLSMADVAMAVDRAAQGRVVIHAISRHGLVPATQTLLDHRHQGVHDRVLLQAASGSVRCLVRSARALTEEARRNGGDWHEVIGSLRALAPSLWQRLSAGERQRFLRHVRCYWDVHRHRLPESSTAAGAQAHHTLRPTARPCAGRQPGPRHLARARRERLENAARRSGDQLHRARL
jgi:uncharacterized NAD(P)/FAD-binding protein YdhS